MSWPEQMTFLGNRAGDLLGRVIGPLADGRSLRITKATYDTELGLTRAQLTVIEPDWTGEQVNNPDTTEETP